MRRLFAAIGRRFVHRHTRRAPRGYAGRWSTSDCDGTIGEITHYYDLEAQRYFPIPPEWER